MKKIFLLLAVFFLFVHCGPKQDKVEKSMEN